MYSNRRREHIHVIRQFEAKTEAYTGTRLVIYKRNGLKYIEDYGNFIKHIYKNSKSKIHSKSLWTIKNSNITGIIKKEMINANEEGTLKMKHVLYESPKIPMNQYYKQVFEAENLYINNEIKIFFN